MGLIKKLSPLPGIIPAIDVIDLNKYFEITEKLCNCEGVAALKIGSLPVCEYGFKKVAGVPGLKIYDAQKGASDIPYIVARQVRQVARYGFIGIIGNPLGAGRKTLETFVEECFKENIIPIIVVEMSHEDALSYSSQKKAEQLAKDFAEMGGKYIVAPATRPKRIEIYKKIGERFGNGFYVISPGIGPQKTGNVIKDAYDAIIHGADYVIIGRAIYKSPNPETVVKEIYKSILEAYQNRN